MKALYDFVKVLSVLLVLSGIGFIFNGLYDLAIISLVSFVILVFIDSDWVFNNLKIDNPTNIVATITAGLLFINVFFIWQEMQYSPLISQIKPEHVEDYIAYEDKLFSIMEPCAQTHNELMNKMSINSHISREEIKKVHSLCFISMSNIKNETLPDKFPASLQKPSLKNQEELQRIAMNLSAFNYSSRDPQTSLRERVKASLDRLVVNMEDIRQKLEVKEVVPASKRSFIKI